MAERIQRIIMMVLVAIMVVELVFLVISGRWMSAFLVLSIIAVTVTPLIFFNRLPVNIPAEFYIMTVVFIFATLFLGEIRDYYNRIWWWDLALHTSSGLLLGLLGFLLVYVLNENERIDLHLHPRFVALFAFFFSLSVGALWEIFEYSADTIFGMNMQKPMLGDASGLTDTMWDLIVDTLGALIISLMGWWYMSKKVTSFIDVWIRKFIDSNPKLFNSKSASTE